MKARLKVVSIMAVSLCAISFCASTAKAELITIEIEAEIDSVSDPYNFFGGNIKVGDIIKGTYTYDTSTPDSVPSFPTIGRYEHYTPYGISLTVSSFEFKTDLTSVDFLVAIANNVTSSGLHDSYWIYSYNNVPLSDGTSVDQIYWSLRDYSATALSSIDLKSTAPILHDWQSNLLMISGPDRGKSFGINAHVISAIPEPGTIFIFGLGCLLLRKRK